MSMFRVKGMSAKFSTCSALWRGPAPKNKLYKKEMNRFVRDVGVSRQMNKLGIDKTEDIMHPESINAETNFEEMLEQTSNLQKQIDQDPDRIKRILIMKKLFPAPKQPNLLTNAEKETIRHLHQKDPHEWTLERLAESFPIDTYGVKKVLRSKLPRNAERVRQLDQQAVDNWKLLSKGKLELDPSLQNHLKHFHRKYIELGQEDHKRISENMRLEDGPSKPKLVAGKGEFTRIISDYEDKISKASDESRLTSTSDGVSQVDLGEMQSLFGDNTLPGTPWTDESSPYGETSLIATSIDLGREASMDIERFREQYLSSAQAALPPVNTRTLRPFSDSASQENPTKTAYLAWIQAQDSKSRQVTKNIRQVNVDEVISAEGLKMLTEDKAGGENDDEMEVRVGRSEETGQQEVYVFNPNTGKQTLSVSDSPDFIEIPKDVKHKYKFFQFGDSLYDNEGEFLYRVPGSTS